MRVQPPNSQYLYYNRGGLRPRRPSRWHHHCHIVLTLPFSGAFAGHTIVWAQFRVKPPKYHYVYYKGRGLRPRRPTCDIMMTSPNRHDLTGPDMTSTWLRHDFDMTSTWLRHNFDMILSYFWQDMSCHYLSDFLRNYNCSLNYSLNILGLCQLDLDVRVGRCLGRLNLKFSEDCMIQDLRLYYL